MNPREKFVALGGGQNIGASCYFLQVDNKNIMLDCGKKIINNHVSVGPDLGVLLEPPLLTSLSQLDNLFVSHGHFDHIGYVPELVEQSNVTSIISSPLTKELGDYLMWDGMERLFDSFSSKQKIVLANRIETAMRRFQTAGYNQPIKFRDYQVTLFAAGHIPGAAMIYIETDQKSILYTGDFSSTSTLLANGYSIPPSVKPDLLILCGVHAKHPHYCRENNLEYDIKNIKARIKNNTMLFLSVKQLTKGIEILQIILKKISKSEFPYVKIFIDDSLWNIAEKFANVGMKVLEKNCYRMPSKDGITEEGLYIGNGRNNVYSIPEYKIDFSLHANYKEIKNFITTYAQKDVIIVHSSEDREGINNYALEKELYEFNFIYPNNGEIYLI